MNTTRRTDGTEVADVFRTYGSAYQEAYKLPTQSLKVMSAIEKCRTSELGGIKYQCDNDRCSHMVISYKPCGNRHCPKCDFLKKEKWLLARQRDLLPVTYYHNVFTIPEELNPLTLVNQRVIYDILFRAGSETLIDLCKDSKHMGGQIGLIAVLHTWGQNMMDHPHLHCIVPGGGLSFDEKRWLKPKKTTKDKDFFIHINIISDLFKKKFLAYLKRTYQKGELTFVGKTAYLRDQNQFQALVDKLYAKEWVSYCKVPFQGAKKVLEYLGRYVYKVAISNHRIVKIADDRVTFRWWDYRSQTEKLMTLEVFEFIRRFLLHVLPKGYFKIRYYGIFASRNLKTKLYSCKQLLAIAVNQDIDELLSLSWQDFIYELLGIDFRKCPKCKKGRMNSIELLPASHGPP